jgi:large repetitive protein
MSGTVPSRVTPKRALIVLLLVLSAAVVFVPGAAAGNFDEELMGCAGENPATCPTGTVGQPYSIKIYLLPRDGERGEDWGCATFHATSGTFPPGLIITDEGYITGTPTQAGIFDFYLTVRYDKNPGCFKPASDDTFIIRINPGVPKLVIGPETAPVGTVGAAYNLQMTANLPDAKTWSIASGALPAGLTINASSGVISGTPTTAGESTFTVQAAIDAQRSDTKTLTIAVRSPLVANATRGFDSDTRTAQTEVGLAFSARLTATGGQGPYTWTLTGSLPEGIEFDATTGTLSGTAELPGTFRFTLAIADSEGRTATYPATIAVAKRLSVQTKRLKNAKVGRLYRSKLASTGGVAPVTWKLKRGPLPKGIRFDRATGSFAGVPTKAGTWVITVEITDALRVKATSNVFLVVAASPKS